MANSRNEHKRGIKHGHVPADLPKIIEMKMMEEIEEVEIKFGLGSIQVVPKKAVRTYCKDIAKKAKAVLKERTRKLIEEYYSE